MQLVIRLEVHITISTAVNMDVGPRVDTATMIGGLSLTTNHRRPEVRTAIEPLNTPAAVHAITRSCDWCGLLLAFRVVPAVQSQYWCLVPSSSQIEQLTKMCRLVDAAAAEGHQVLSSKQQQRSGRTTEVAF